MALNSRYSPRNGPGAADMLLHACQSSRHTGPLPSMPVPILHAHPCRLALSQLHRPALVLLHGEWEKHCMVCIYTDRAFPQ